MKDNFDFLKNIDNELFGAIEDAQKLFRDEYFNQCAVSVRIFAEKMAKKVLGAQSEGLTFDDTLNCLKDKIKTEREKEFIDDLFFIKKEGNKCAHGEDIAASDALETIKRAFEAAINYAYSRKKDENIDKLQFDTTLLITGKPLKENNLVQQYVELASNQKEELLNQKQEEFQVHVKENKKQRKPLSPQKQKIKEKVKQAKKNLKQNINKKPKKPTKKEQRIKQEQKKEILKLVLFLIFVTISLVFLTKMLFFF